ncbi:MAG: adenylate/guanylate cyclase domain-containing protein [Acidiferrobacterales bacterium]
MANRPSRELAVLLHADVVGSTTLVQKDEALAHQRIQAAFHRFSELIGSYGGTAHEIRGDALVAEFSRASDAVSAALAFQTANHEHNAGLTDDIRPAIRVGVSLGEVVIADGTVTGAGVVLAQRLEQLAQPEGVVVQGAVSEAIPTRLPFTYESLGEQTLKGFDQPVRAFTVQIKSDEKVPEPEFAEGMAIAASRSPAPESSAASESAPPQITAEQLEITSPSVVVLPFDVMENVPDQQYLADGVTENIITALTRFRELFVIGTRSSFAAKARSMSVKQLGMELGVQHVVTGSIRQLGERIRVTAQLLDAASGRQLWAENYDREVRDLLALQDDIANLIVSTLAGHIEDAGRELAARKDVKDMAAYDHVLRGRECLARYTKEGVMEARAHFTRALELEHEHAPAYAGLARSYLWEYWAEWTHDPEAALDNAFELASRAVSLDGSDHGAHKTLSMCYLHKRQYDMAIVHIEKCIALNPNDYGGFCDKSWLLALSGKPAEGVECSFEGLRRNPFSRGMCLMNAGVAHYTARHYEDAVREFSESMSFQLWRLAGLAASYAQLGEIEIAQKTAGELLRYAKSELAIDLGEDRERWLGYWQRVFPFKHSEEFEHLLEGLRKAGLPA